MYAVPLRFTHMLTHIAYTRTLCDMHYPLSKNMKYSLTLLLLAITVLSSCAQQPSFEEKYNLPNDEEMQEIAKNMVENAFNELAKDEELLNSGKCSNAISSITNEEFFSCLRIIFNNMKYQDSYEINCNKSIPEMNSYDFAYCVNNNVLSDIENCEIESDIPTITI